MKKRGLLFRFDFFCTMESVIVDRKENRERAGYRYEMVKKKTG